MDSRHFLPSGFRCQVFLTIFHANLVIIILRNNQTDDFYIVKDHIKS